MPVFAVAESASVFEFELVVVFEGMMSVAVANKCRSANKC